MAETSRIPGFYRLAIDERLELVAQRAGLPLGEGHTLGTGGLDPSLADRMIENVVGVYGLPLGIAHDPPHITPPERCRFDAAWTIDEPLPPECGIGQQTIGGGTWATTTVVGPFHLIGIAYQTIGERLMRHADSVQGSGGSVEWYRTGSIDEEHYLNQIDITFPVTARAGCPRVLE